VRWHARGTLLPKQQRSQRLFVFRSLLLLVDLRALSRLLRRQCECIKQPARAGLELVQFVEFACFGFLLGASCSADLTACRAHNLQSAVMLVLLIRAALELISAHVFFWVFPLRSRDYIYDNGEYVIREPVARTFDRKRPRYGNYITYRLHDTVRADAGSTTYRSTKQDRFGLTVCVRKVFDVLDCSSRASSLLEELRLCRHFDAHPNMLGVDSIVRPISTGGWSEGGYSNLLIIEEFAPSSLSDVLSTCPRIAEHTVRSWMWQLLCALEHMHAAGVVHTALSPSCVLLTTDGQVKVSATQLSSCHVIDTVLLLLVLVPLLVLTLQLRTS
jgi:serine/threonine protein kinase